MRMMSRRNLIEATFAIVAGSAVSLTAMAAEQTPKDFLDAIYKKYIGKNAKGLPLDKPATMRLFTPALRKAIDDDSRRAAKRNEVPNLDGDPFVDAQDWDIKSFDISVQDKAPDKATGTVKFDNDGDKKTVTLDLVKSSDGWHIDEITTADGTLRKILSGK
jgi:Protein of unknown function (DUF3828)